MPWVLFNQLNGFGYCTNNVYIFLHFQKIGTA